MAQRILADVRWSHHQRDDVSLAETLEFHSNATSLSIYFWSQRTMCI
jgi:hypothetical protein